MIREGTCRQSPLMLLLSCTGALAMLACQPARGAEAAEPGAMNGGEGVGNERRAQGKTSGASDASSGTDVNQSPAAPQTEGRKVQLEDGREAQPSQALPELSFSHLGMHIGGESNSAEAKSPWLKGIDAGEEQILRCYVFVNDPASGGSYGVDLYVGRDGGAPEVRGSRQKIGGEEFDACMKQAFRQLNFAKPERPTVLSYSLLFALDG